MIPEALRIYGTDLLLAIVVVVGLVRYGCWRIDPMDDWLRVKKLFGRRR